MNNYTNWTQVRHCCVEDDKLLDLHVRPYHKALIWIDDKEMAGHDIDDVIGMTYGELLNTLRSLYGTQKVSMVVNINAGNTDMGDWYVYRQLSIHTGEFSGNLIVSYTRTVNFFA